MRIANIPPVLAFQQLEPIEQHDAAHVNLLSWRITAGSLMMSDLELACLDLALAVLRQKHTDMLLEAAPLDDLHEIVAKPEGDPT